jgi:Ser/Thr protein kinase RdoA (MazF antagonist)
MRIMISPLDAAYPQLVRFSDPAYVSALMDDAASVVVVRYRPGQRHVLRYELAQGRGPTVFAKLYRDNTGARVDRVTRAVADLFADQPGDNAVARPWAYLDGEERVLLVPLVAGVPLSIHLRSNVPGTGAHLLNAGAILRQLHDAPDEIGRLVEGRHLEAELDATASASATIRQLMPATGRLVRDVLEKTRHLLGGLPAAPPCFSHGDYKADHLLVGRAGLTVIDFDRAARRDPALDLAKFLADLRWWSGTGASSSAESAQAEFIRGYGVSSGGLLKRAQLLEPLFLVKAAARRVPVHEPAWEQRTTVRVEQAAQLLHDRAHEAP